MNRFFAFGCSFTNYFFPTWADYIGYGVNEYYNLGCPGLSNTTMAMRFVEADCHYKFDHNDLVIVALSGIGRYNFLVETPQNTTALWAGGDLEKDANDSWILNNPKLKPYYKIISFMRDSFWKRKWGIYYTWLAVNTMKRILISNNIPHKIFAALDMSFYKDKELLGLNDQEVQMMNEIYNSLDVKLSLQEFSEKCMVNPFNDSHPFVDNHFNFCREFLNEHLDDKASDFHNEILLECTKYKTKDDTYKNLARFKMNKMVNKLYAEYT